MRKTPTVLLLGLAVPAFSALPVLSVAPEPKPVEPVVHSAVVAGVDATSLRSPDGATSKDASAQARREIIVPARRGEAPSRPDVLTAERSAASFDLLGVTWAAGTGSTDLTVLVRTHSGGGWSEWNSLDVAPTPGKAEGANDIVERAGTEPLYAGESDGYQVRVDVRDGALPDDVRVDLVDPGSSRADATVGHAAPAASAAAETAQPAILSRADWGADESLRGTSPRYNSTIKAGFVHHTAGVNGYSETDVPKIIRGIYAYHTKVHGWSDIGYNFLVDRFGRTWEGRYGGITRAVMGAHTGGFNTDTFGVSAIGDYGKVDAPPVMVEAIARVLAWKLSLYFRDPFGQTTLISEGGGTSRFARGTVVPTSVISGHRDMGNTSCPGTFLYAQLPTIRNLVAGTIGPSLVNPAAVPPSTPYGVGPIAFTTFAARPQSLHLDIRERCGGDLVRTLDGSADPGAVASLAWDLNRSDGTRARPGDYDVTLSGTSPDGVPRSWQSSVAIVPSPESFAAGVVTLSCDASFVPVNPTRLYDSRTRKAALGAGRQVDVTVLGRAGVPTAGVVAVALNVTAVKPAKTTFLTAFPTGGRRPTGWSLSLAKGTTRSASVVAALGLKGRVSVGNYTGSTNVLVDIAGYYAVPAGTGQLFHPTKAFRVYDSRRDPAGMLADNASRSMALPAVQGVPADQMGAVAINVTAISGSGAGFLTAHPDGSSRPLASTLNFASAAPVTNGAIVRLSAGRLKVTNRGRAAHVTVDVVGFFAPPTVQNGQHFRALAPTRMLDTRQGRGAARRPLVANGRLNVRVAGAGPVPADATAVVMTLSASGATRSTYLKAWPAGTGMPGPAVVNVQRGVSTGNLVVVAVGGGGAVSIFNRFGSTHVVGDVVGYYH